MPPAPHSNRSVVVRTRFAPSPTGSLHLGNARVAVLNWLLARHHGGAFILRIEDTDPERNVPGAEATILRDLRWLGLDWDEGPLEGGGAVGGHGPYRQSERGQRYREAARALLDSGAAYLCSCADHDGAGEPLTHDDEACSTRAQEAADPGAVGGAALRLRAPRDGADLLVQDAVRGTVRFPADAAGDFVILRSDGSPTYNFAVVVDDVDMAITHVVRGVGHLSNTPRQLLVYRALGVTPPVFAHIPTVLSPEGGKLSKRAGAKGLAELREAGVHPDAVVNYLSLLSWSSASGEDVLPRERLIREVSLERIGSGDVKHDPDRLRWLSARYLEGMTLDELVEAVRPHVRGAGLPVSAEALPTAVAGVRTHLTALADINDQLRRYLPSEDVPPPLGEEGVRVVAAAVTELAALPTWDDDGALEAAVRRAGAAAGARGRALFEPLRMALTGEAHGPPLAAILRVQGRDGSLGRLRRAAQAAP